MAPQTDSDPHTSEALKCQLGPHERLVMTYEVTMHVFFANNIKYEVFSKFIRYFPSHKKFMRSNLSDRILQS